MLLDRKNLIITGAVCTVALAALLWLLLRPGLKDDFDIETSLQPDTHLSSRPVDPADPGYASLEEGIPDGYGINKRPDGAVYVGNFQNGQSHGRGKLTYPGGASYEGEFSEGQPHGKGICTYSSGRTEDCEFLLGQRQ